MSRRTENRRQRMLNLLARRQANFIEVGFCHLLPTGGIVERFLGEIQLFRATEAFKSGAGDLDLLGNGMASVDFNGDQRRRRESKGLSLVERIPRERVIVNFREI